MRAAPGIRPPVRHAGPRGDRHDAGYRTGYRHRDRGGRDSALEVRTAGGLVAVTAGDMVHVRPVH